MDLIKKMAVNLKKMQICKKFIELTKTIQNMNNQFSKALVSMKGHQTG